MPWCRRRFRTSAGFRRAGSVIWTSSSSRPRAPRRTVRATRASSTGAERRSRRPSSSAVHVATPTASAPTSMPRSSASSRTLARRPRETSCAASSTGPAGSRVDRRVRRPSSSCETPEEFASVRSMLLAAEGANRSIVSFSAPEPREDTQAAGSGRVCPSSGRAAARARARRGNSCSVTCVRSFLRRLGPGGLRADGRPGQGRPDAAPDAPLTPTRWCPAACWSRRARRG